MNKATASGTAKEPKIMECVCEHPYQDSKYGKQRRVMNPCKKGMGYRCTVCSKERNA